MGWAEHLARVGEKRKAYRFFKRKNVKQRCKVGVLDDDGHIIITKKEILNKWFRRALIGLIRHRIRTRNGVL
jgi:hypothetical protein